MENLLVWAEIPASDAERAAKFYSTLFDTELKAEEAGPRKIVMLPGADENSIAASVMEVEGFNPGKNGVLIYLASPVDLDEMSKRIISAGGSIIKEKSDLGGGIGLFLMFNDSEGNTIAFYGNK